MGILIVAHPVSAYLPESEYLPESVIMNNFKAVVDFKWKS